MGAYYYRFPIDCQGKHLQNDKEMISELIQVLTVIRPGQIIEVFHAEMKPIMFVRVEAARAYLITPHKSPSVRNTRGKVREVAFVT